MNSSTLMINAMAGSLELNMRVVLLTRKKDKRKRFCIGSGVPLLTIR